MYKVLCLLSEIEERCEWERDDSYFENQLYAIEGMIDELLEEEEDAKLQEVLELITDALGSFQEGMDEEASDRFRNLEITVKYIIKFIENN